MTITDPYKEIHALQEKIAQLYDEYAGKPCEQIRHMEEVAELRKEIEQLKQERSEMCSIIDGSIKEINRYREALEEIVDFLRQNVGSEEILRNHVTTYQIAQRALDDE